ncbi:MAG: hypothetical protein AABY15_06440 [Nanoarchaeota archaeon]
MSELALLEGIVTALPHLTKLNEEKLLNKDKCSVLNSDEVSPEKFWDSLNKGKYHMFGRTRQYHSKIDIGGMAIHQGFMTPNYGWNCSKTKFKDLPKRQQKIIAATLKCKDELYTIVSIRGMCGKLFRI